MDAAFRVAGIAIAFGAIGFALGYFGPVVIAPGIGHGHLFALFVTGPLGVLVGLVVGALREVGRGRRHA